MRRGIDPDGRLAFLTLALAPAVALLALALVGV